MVLIRIHFHVDVSTSLAMFDCCGHIIYSSIIYGDATANYPLFKAKDLFIRLNNGLMKKDLDKNHLFYLAVMHV